jgi:hypothetical protein
MYWKGILLWKKNCRGFIQIVEIVVKMQKAPNKLTSAMMKACLASLMQRTDQRIDFGLWDVPFLN